MERSTHLKSSPSYRNRWFILFVLFFARTAMAFQFQSVAALSPFIIDSLALTLIEIGLLIGLYLGPGIIVATVGGTIASRIGDKVTVSVSLGLMLLGSLMVTYAPSVEWVMAGRVVSGVGGVVINVVMTKMVIDWFADRSISMAMSLFVSSWPLGIALSLLVLPSLAVTGGLVAGWWGVTIATVVALTLFGLTYQPAPGAAQTSGSLKSTALPWAPLIYAAMVWGLYNAAFAMLFGFGTLVLVGQGLSAPLASSATSIYMLTATIAIPVGGWLVDRTKRRDTVILVSLVAGVLMFPAILYLPASYAGFTLGVTGFLVGLCAGLIVSLPSYILSAEARAFGTGIFYSIYYLLMMIAPPLAGAVADSLGNVNSAFVLGALMMTAAIILLLAFRRGEQRLQSAN